jgi:O-antigen chain-terminating methyltransferase
MARWLLGGDLRAELEGIHVALGEAMEDLSRDLLEALEAQHRVAVDDILKRTDLLIEQLDRRTEGLTAGLARRIGALERHGRPMSVKAYAEFENRIRGTEGEVCLKMRPHIGHFRMAPVVDLGCGRGELLEEFRRVDVPAYGVDSNKVMVAKARAKGLRVLHEDLFDHLARLEPNAVGGEHLTPAAVRHLLAEAKRVLCPGGCLLLETANPASLWSHARDWGRDPMHRWSPHPETLQFMAERAGFNVVNALFTAPVPEQDRLKGLDADPERLNDVLFGPRDFVLVAEKPLPGPAPADAAEPAAVAAEPAVVPAAALEPGVHAE